MTILQSLVALYDRLERRGEPALPQPGYAPVGISFVIPIESNGSVRPAIDIRDASTRRPTPTDRQVPKLRDHNNSGKDPFLFWDNTGYALGSVKKEMKRGTPQELFDRFREANLVATAGASCTELRAFRAFLETWKPEFIDALAIPDQDLDTNVIFRSVETGELIHEVPEAKQIWCACRIKNEQGELCLVTGDRLPPARLHPKFPALEAGGNKAPIVSFNEKSFESYGKDQGANAPVSEDAAFKYGAALNWLLDRNNARAFRLGETTVVFWADERPETGGEVAAAAAEDVIWGELGQGDAGEPEAETSSEDANEGWQSDDEADADRDLDAEDAGTIRGQMQRMKDLRHTPDRSKLQPETRVYILGLSPNSGRTAVRFYLDDTFGHLEENLMRHKRDMEIEPAPPNPNQKAYALLYETAVQRKAENIPPRLGGELARAILSGGRYPRTLLTAVIGRVRADKTVNATRAALCKAIINRDHDEEVIPVALNPESDDGAYNLGRLFAVYEYAERSVADRNATIKDKYIGAASATPRRVFPILMRGYEHNASALAKGEGNQRGSGVKAAKTISQILERFGGEAPFPTALKLEEQSRFFVGYYHQMAALYTKADKANQVSDTEGDDQ